MGSQVAEDSQQGSSWRTKQPHIRVQINQEEQLGSETDHAIQGFSSGKSNLKTSD